MSDQTPKAPRRRNKQLYYATLYVGNGLRLLWRNRFWSVVTMLVVTLLLGVVYTVSALSEHTRQAAQKVDDRLVITAVVAQDDQYKSIVPAAVLAEQVKKIPDVNAVRVITETETQQRFLRNVKNLRAAPAASVFHEALEIQVDDTTKLGVVREQLMKTRGIEEATYLQDLVKRLTAVSDYIQTIAFGGVLFLSAIALLVIMSVVRTAIHSERESVRTMASVGGSAWTITAPLLVHILAIGLLSCVMASLVGWWVDPQIGQLGSEIRDLPSWLQTDRAYGPFQLFLPMFAVTAAAMTVIVVWGTRRYARQR